MGDIAAEPRAPVQDPCLGPDVFQGVGHGRPGEPHQPAGMGRELHDGLGPEGLAPLEALELVAHDHVIGPHAVLQAPVHQVRHPVPRGDEHAGGPLRGGRDRAVQGLQVLQRYLGHLPGPWVQLLHHGVALIGQPPFRDLGMPGGPGDGLGGHDEDVSASQHADGCQGGQGLPVPDVEEHAALGVLEHEVQAFHLVVLQGDFPQGLFGLFGHCHWRHLLRCLSSRQAFLPL